MEKVKKAAAHLKREIGLFGGVSLVAGMTIGSGIYYLGSYVLERANMSMGMALLCWIIGGVISILGGLCFAELGAEMPVDRKSTRLNSSHKVQSRMPSSA